MKLEVETLFDFGDIVTLRAMLDGEGRPQKFSVEFINSDSGRQATDVRYYCRAINSWGCQVVGGGPALRNGMYLLGESELVPYPEPK